MVLCVVTADLATTKVQYLVINHAILILNKMDGKLLNMFSMDRLVLLFFTKKINSARVVLNPIGSYYVSLHCGFDIIRPILQDIKSEVNDQVMM